MVLDKLIADVLSAVMADGLLGAVSEKRSWREAGVKFRDTTEQRCNKRKAQRQEAAMNQRFINSSDLVQTDQSPLQQELKLKSNDRVKPFTAFRRTSAALSGIPFHLPSIHYSCFDCRRVNA